MSYVLSPVAGGAAIDLGSFTLPAAGAYVSPGGYISALAGIDADFNVSVTLSDGGTQTKSLPNQFVANVRSECSPVERLATSALAYPGPFANAPQSGAVAGSDLANGASGSAASTGTTGTAGATGTTGTAGAAGSPPLATTGSDAPLLASTSLVLMALGGFLMVASRREDREAR